MDQTTNIYRYVALLVTAEEYGGYVKEPIIEIFTQELSRNLDGLPRDKRRKQERLNQKTIEEFLKAFNMLQNRLSKFSGHFISDKKYEAMTDKFIDSIHESLQEIK